MPCVTNCIDKQLQDHQHDQIYCKKKIQNFMINSLLLAAYNYVKKKVAISQQLFLFIYLFYTSVFNW